jgi:hypothetical protein
MGGVTAKSVVVAKAEPLAAPLAGGLVILQVDTDRYYNLNELGSRVWELIQQPATVADVVGEIASTYDVDAARCESDVLALLQDMDRAQLITVR